MSFDEEIFKTEHAVPCDGPPSLRDLPLRLIWADGETVHSHLSRMRYLLGDISNGQMRIEAFGTSPKHSSVTMPGNLGHLAEVLPAGGPSLDELIQQHTTYPYHTAFMTEDARLRLRTMLISGWETGVQGWMGSRRATVPRCPYLAFCPSCSREHLCKLGTCAWVCAHQLPGVEVCHRHGDRLRIGPWETGHTTHFQVCPERAELYPEIPLLLPRDLMNPFARESAKLLQRQWRFPSAMEVHAGMARIVAEAGFVRHGQIQRQDLEEFVRGHLGVEVMDTFGMVDVVGIQPRLLHALHEQRAKAFSPPCRYLLLLVLLGKGIEDLHHEVSAAEIQSDTAETKPSRRRALTAATLDRHKETLRRALAEHPEWTRLDFFRNVRAAYAAVTKDDLAWWDAHAPAPNRIIRRLDYGLRDRRQAQQIRTAGDRLGVLKGARVAITKRMILREAGLPASLKPTRRLSPLTLDALEDLVMPRGAARGRDQAPTRKRAWEASR